MAPVPSLPRPTLRPLADVSKGRRAYRTARTTFRRTRVAPSPIGQQRRPRPVGHPGFVRVDTAHSGDFGGERWSTSSLGSLKCCRPNNLRDNPPDHRAPHDPVLKALVSAFTFRVQGFHADITAPDSFAVEVRGENGHRPQEVPPEAGHGPAREAQVAAQGPMAF